MRIILLVICSKEKIKLNLSNVEINCNNKQKMYLAIQLSYVNVNFKKLELRIISDILIFKKRFTLTNNL